LQVQKAERALVNKTSLSFTENANGYTAGGKNFSVTIDKQNGALISYLYKGTEQIKAPLLPHFTRPQTDNDRKGWKTHRVLKAWYDNTAKLVSISAARIGGQPAVTSTYSLVNDSAKVVINYRLSNDGILKVDFSMTADPALPNLPKVGMQGGIAREYENVSWYGLGLMENYVDRRYGFDAGVYEQNIQDFMESYVVPQENGNRTDVRWMHLSNRKSGNGLLVIADSLLSMSAWPYTEKNISEAKHTHKLVDAGYITLNIDLEQMGVGGNDSWSEVAAPLEQYQIKAQPYRYTFYLTPFNAKDKIAGGALKKIRF